MSSPPPSHTPTPPPEIPPPPAAPPHPPSAPPLPPPDAHIEDNHTEDDFVNIAWLPQSGVHPHGPAADRGGPLQRHRHWSVTGEVPPPIPNHPRFNNWPTTQTKPRDIASTDAALSQPLPPEVLASGSVAAAVSPVPHHNTDHNPDLLLQSSPPSGAVHLLDVHDVILSDGNEDSDDVGYGNGDDNDGNEDGDDVGDGNGDDGGDARLLDEHDGDVHPLMVEDMYDPPTITSTTFQGGTMSQDNPRTLATKESLNLDPDVKAAIDISVTNNIAPNPRPWFYDNHSAFFPDKAVLYIGLFENHSEIFRAAPYKWRAFTDAHIRLLQMFISVLEMYIITPASPSMLGDITAKLQDLHFSNNWCRNLLAARQRILEKMKLECSARTDSPWSRSQKQPPAVGEALGDKDWTIQRLGTSIVWTAYEQEVFSSLILDKMYEPLSLRVQELSTALVTMSRKAAAPPPASGPTTSAVGDPSGQISMGFARQQAMSQVKLNFSKAAKTTPLKEFEMFRIKGR